MFLPYYLREEKKSRRKQSPSLNVSASSNPVVLPSLEDITINELIIRDGIMQLNQLAISDPRLGHILHSRLTNHLLLLVTQRRQVEEFITVNPNLILSKGHVTD